MGDLICGAVCRMYGDVVGCVGRSVGWHCWVSWAWGGAQCIRGFLALSVGSLGRLVVGEMWIGINVCWWGSVILSVVDGICCWIRCMGCGWGRCWR